MGDGCDGCDGFFELHQSSPRNAVLEEPKNLVEGKAEKQVKECRENASHPSHPSPASIPAIENPSPDPSHSSSNPSHTPETLKEHFDDVTTNQAAPLTPEEKKILLEIQSELTGSILWKEGHTTDREMMERLANLKKKADSRLERIACENLNSEDKGVLERLRAKAEKNR
jgi:hypothetical protein